MGTAPINPGNIDPIDLMVEVIEEHSPESIWRGSRSRRLPATRQHQPRADRRRLRPKIPFSRQHPRLQRLPHLTPTDLVIAGQRFEVKTASLGANGTFQFNHVRLDRTYNYLLCLGICPDRIIFNAWRKGVISEGGAGSLVRMAEGQSTTHKLTKRLVEMRPIQELVGWIRDEVVGT